MLRHALPARWRAPLRRTFYEEGFHLRPHPHFTRFRPWRMPFWPWVWYEAGYQLWRRTQGRGARLERPIFMIGCPRSGTGIAVRTFALHPDVANLSEAPEIWDPRHYLDLEAEDAWTAAEVRAEDAARVQARFEYHRRWAGKARFVNKHPPSSVRLEWIRAVFPDAVFLHMIRDGRAVAYSLVEFIEKRPRLAAAPMPMCRPPQWRELVRADRLEESALQWTAVVQHVLAQREKLGAAYHEIRYEEFCADPRGVLGAAYRFAGLRVDDEVLGRLPERLRSSDYKWREKLRAEQVELLERIQRPLLAKLGYLA